MSYQPTLYDLADLQLIQQPNPFVTAQTERTQMQREMLLRNMAVAQTQQLHDALDAQHMQRAQQSRLAEMAVQNQAEMARALAIQSAEAERDKQRDIGRDKREDERVKAAERAALNKEYRDHGITRKPHETDEEFDARASEQVRTNNRSVITAYDQQSDGLTRQIVQAEAKAQAERAAKIESAARDFVGITPENAAVKMKQPGTLQSLAEARMEFAQKIPADPAAQMEVASLRNQLMRLNQAREKVMEIFSKRGDSGALSDIYAPGKSGDATAKPGGLPLPPMPGGAGALGAALAPPAGPQDTRGLIPAGLSGLGDIASQAGAAARPALNVGHNLRTLLFGGNYVPWDQGSLTPDQRAMMTNNQILFGNPNGLMQGGAPLPSNFPVPVQPVLSRDPMGGYPASNGLDLGGLGQLPLMNAPQPDALQPSVNVFPPRPFGGE